MCQRKKFYGMRKILKVKDRLSMTQSKGKVNDLQAGELGLTLVANMPEITLNRIGDNGINNARVNLEYLNEGFSLKELRNFNLGEGDRAVVIAAGWQDNLYS